jgi:hypothetical protein
LSRGVLFLALLAPIILAAVGDGVWMAVVAFSGTTPPPSATETALPSAAPAATATAPVDSYGCPYGGLLSGKVWEEPQGEGTVIPWDVLPIPGATVRIPELGLEAVTDEQGCYSISGPPIEAPRLLTLEFTAPGFRPLTVKNEIFYGGGSGYSPALERGDTPVVIDYCTFEYPPLSAAMQAWARLCVEAGVAPNYLMLDCPLPDRHQDNILLASIVGSVVDAATSQPIAGATVTIEEYDESRVVSENGCFLFDPLVLPTAEGRFITLEVTAAGYRPLILEHFWLTPIRAVDVKLEAGTEPQTVDYCVFISLPREPQEKMQAERCRRQGVLVLPGK